MEEDSVRGIGGLAASVANLLSEPPSLCFALCPEWVADGSRALLAFWPRLGVFCQGSGLLSSTGSAIASAKPRAIPS